MVRHPPYVGVVGPSEAGPDLVDLARAVGAGIAARGWVVVTGGLGGVMAAAAAGAASAGGTVVGLLPGEHRSAASAGHTVVITTGLGELRNALLVRTCDGRVCGRRQLGDPERDRARGAGRAPGCQRGRLGAAGARHRTVR